MVEAGSPTGSNVPDRVQVQIQVPVKLGEAPGVVTASISDAKLSALSSFAGASNPRAVSSSSTISYSVCSALSVSSSSAGSRPLEGVSLALRLVLLSTSILSQPPQINAITNSNKVFRTCHPQICGQKCKTQCEESFTQSPNRIRAVPQAGYLKLNPARLYHAHPESPEIW